HPGRIALDRAGLLGLDGPLAVDRLAEGVDDTPDERLSDRHLGDAPGTLDDVALLDGAVVAQQYRAHVVLLEVQDQPVDLAGELEELAGHRLLEAVDPGDPVPDLDDAAHFGEVGLRLEAL